MPINDEKSISAPVPLCLKYRSIKYLSIKLETAKKNGASSAIKNHAIVMDD